MIGMEVCRAVGAVRAVGVYISGLALLVEFRKLLY